MPQLASKRRIRNLDQVHRAIQERKAGLSYEAIGRALKVSTSTAHRLVMAGLKELQSEIREEAEEIRALELQRLDAQHEALWNSRSDPVAANTLLKIQARRAALLGLDAPVKQALTDAEGHDVFDADARRVLRERLLGGKP